jgi:mannose-6-phosphate isomerase-like protein (cupin superfamily)
MPICDICSVMRNTLLLVLVVSLAVLSALQAADPAEPIYWSAAKTRELAQQAKSRLGKETGMGVSQLMDSAFMVHREKTSQAEAHAKQADFLIINEGAGSILVGGKIVKGQTTRPGEIRGESIEGGTRYPVKAGDTLYVPKAMPHQFEVTPGQYIVYTVVKITPVE